MQDYKSLCAVATNWATLINNQTDPQQCDQLIQGGQKNRTVFRSL